MPMATVSYTTKDKKYTYQIHPVLHSFLEGFGLEIMYMVKEIPSGLPFIAHSQLRPCHCYLYGKVGDKLYLNFAPGTGRTRQYFRLFT